MSAVGRVNQSVKHWLGWMVLVVALVGVISVAVGRDRGPQTQQERIESIAARLACPTCDGESVEVSRAPAAVAIRNEIARQVAAGQSTDDQIIGNIEQSYGGQVLLVPRASGLDALVWVLPVTVAVLALASLAVVFRRWRRESDAYPDPTDADRELVAEALAQRERPDGGES
jgi:cytochrome c-type biogenesis protein CcmH